MKKKDIEKFNVILSEERKKIVRHLESISDSAEEHLEPAAGDPVDIASLGISQASLQKIGKRESYLLKKIDYALKKIGDGTYGECENCGEDIAIKRLKARPVALLCIDCKTEQENTERKFSSKDANDDDASFDDES